MPKRKLSVQINIEGKDEKTFVVPSFLVQNWKKLLISSVSLIVGMVGIIVYLTTRQNIDAVTSHYTDTLDKVTQENKLLSWNNSTKEKEINKAKKSFNKIDSTLEIINSKMKKRGLKTIALENAGGPVEMDEENIELLSSYYEEMLADLDKKLESIPLGTPHHGRITSRFGYRRNPFTNRGREMHSGIDLKGRTGDRVKSTAKGTVIFSGYEGQYGYVVKIKHADNYETRYAHLSRPLVKRGQKVAAGDIIGLLGSTGRSTGPHLHYEILKNNKKINPEKYFSL
ncbi:MAG TPA: M23 family metallopeptidase [Sphingobacterium sp.]|nr:M23 family metallopeptidase [Sphingobacterium sp.]